MKEMVYIEGLDDRLGIPYPEINKPLEITIDDALAMATAPYDDSDDWTAPRDNAWLTTDHARSSYGKAVIVKDSGNGPAAYGPGDLPGVVICLLPIHELELGDTIRAAGWTTELTSAPDLEGYWRGGQYIFYTDTERERILGHVNG